MPAFKALLADTVEAAEFSPELPLGDIIPPEQKENLQEFVENLHASIDHPPSEESLEQWQTTLHAAAEDGTISPDEWQAIAIATADVLGSMGLTKAELRSLAYDLQDIADASRFAGEDDLLTGTDSDDLLMGETGDDILIGTPDDGTGEIDFLIGGGGADTFVLGNDTTVFYDDGFARTMGIADYAAIADFNLEHDTIQLHGSAADYSLGALPADSTVEGTAIYVTTGITPELVGVVVGVALTDFSTGFTFVG